MTPPSDRRLLRIKVIPPSSDKELLEDKRTTSVHYIGSPREQEPRCLHQTGFSLLENKAMPPPSD